MKCRLNRGEPTKEQRDALKKECIKEFDKLLWNYNHQVAMQVLYILRFEYGFGQDRLKRFADKLSEMQKEIETTYELGAEQNWFVCEEKLKKSGIDVDEIMGEKK